MDSRFELHFSNRVRSYTTRRLLRCLESLPCSAIFFFALSTLITVVIFSILPSLFQRLPLQNEAGECGSIYQYRVIRNLPLKLFVWLQLCSFIAALICLFSWIALKPHHPPGTPGPTSASPACKAAIAAANQALDHAQKFEAALAKHTEIMNAQDSGKISADQAMMMGQPSLRRGASESVRFDQALSTYQPVAAECRGRPSSMAGGTPGPGGATQECVGALEASDRALSQAGKVESALTEHSKVMTDFEYGRISAQQLRNLALPPLVRGASDSAKFDQVLHDYQQQVKRCR